MILSEKQKEFIRECNHRYNIKYGATRSGKTYLDILYLIPKRLIERKGKNGLNMILGVTRSTIERNVLEPMREIYGETLVSRINSMNIATLFGEKVYCLGASAVDQVSKLRGSSIKYCYCDELAEYNEEVFELLKSRLDKEYSCLDATLNPTSPSHWVKTFIESKADVYSQQYTIFDNKFLSPIFIENLCKEYEGTVYYDRYILGKWCNAEGIIYRLFADHTEDYLIDEVKDDLLIVTIGIDYGAGMSKTKFVATGITQNYEKVIILDEMDLLEVYDPEQLYNSFMEFYKRIIEHFGKCQYAFCDYGALGNVLTLGLIKKCQAERLPIKVADCEKGRIKDRIFLTSSLMAQHRFEVLRKNKVVIKAFQEALWNSKIEDERLDDGTTDIDSLDAFEYSINSFYERLIRSKL